jgi:phosphate transport system substrate-binding protein
MSDSKTGSAGGIATLFAMFAWVAAVSVGCSDARSTIRIDGSSTVYPLSEAVAEEFGNERPNVRVTVGLSGTGGGMKKFIAGEIDVCDASRAIKDSEIEACAKNGVEFVELQAAFDGLAVVVNPENVWCDCLTVDQLRDLWKPDSTVRRWSDLNPDWPAEDIQLYGPGTDSGTFEYFTEAVVGEAKASRADYTASEDDNTLVRGVQSDRYALGYFGFAYYEENRDDLKLVGIDSGAGCVQPSAETVRDNSYQPLSRPLYIYVHKSSLQRPEVLDFVTFYLEHAGELASLVGYVPAPPEAVARNRQNLQNARQ